MAMNISFKIITIATSIDKSITAPCTQTPKFPKSAMTLGPLHGPDRLYRSTTLKITLENMLTIFKKFLKDNMSSFLICLHIFIFIRISP